MHKVKVRGVPGVDWEQLEGKCPSIYGRFEQFQCCLHRSKSVDDGKLVWCQKKLPFEKVFSYLILLNVKVPSERS